MTSVDTAKAAPKNSPKAKAHSAMKAGAGQLKAFIERIERLDEERRTIAEDIKEVFQEAKGNGFDVKIMRKLVAIRRIDLNKRREEEELLDTYMSALGML